MRKLDDEIIGTADSWQKKKHEREMLRIERAHDRRRFILENLFDIPGLILVIAIVIVAAVTCANYAETTTDCSKADKEQLERIHRECESLVDSIERTECWHRATEFLCEERVVAGE